MVNDGRSSLQKAAGLKGSSSSLRRGSNSKNRGTETSFEIGAPVARPPVVSSTVAKTPSSHTISGASYTVGEDRGATAAVAGARRGSKTKTKSSQHFTIISAHDEQQQQQQQQHDHSDSAMDVDHHYEVSNGSMELDVTVEMPVENLNPPNASTSKTQTFLQIGGGFQEERKTEIGVSLAPSDDHDDRHIEQMEGVIDQGTKMPLVVLDGANVAYAYASVMEGKNNSSIEAANTRNKLEPDNRGLQIATQFFLEAGIRVLVVLPQYWFRGSNSKPQLEILNDLKSKGLIVGSPPADDDDAYALTISRREESRSCKPPRNGEGQGFVLSNDLFRDAQERDSPNGTLKEWLTKGRNADVGPGRISYTFGDMGTMNDRGERVLDFVPNPRHPLVIWIEGKNNEINGSG